MIYTEAMFFCYGENYSPARAQKLIPVSFAEKNEVGEIGSIGLYENKPIPFGSSSLHPPCQMTLTEPDFGMEWLLSFLINHRAVFDLTGATSLVLRLEVRHDGQCNLEFNEEQLQMIADAKVALTISCEMDEEYVQKKMDEVRDLGHA